MRKYSVEIAVFVAGAATMIIEIFGLNILAPHFGTALTVISNEIGVVLAGLSWGYYRGGQRADKNGVTHRDLSILLLYAALFVGIIFPFYDFIGGFFRELIFITSIASFLAAIFLFFIPSVFLGATLPYAVKIHTTTISTAGRRGGALYALSAIGSVAGTFLCGFLLIPYFGMPVVFLVTTFLLFGASALLEFRPRALLLLPIAALLFFVGGKIEYPLQARDIVFDGAFRIDRSTLKKLADTISPYSRIRIYEGTELESGKIARLMRINREIHSGTFLDSNELIFKYARFNRFGGHFNPDAKHALLIGGGGYSYANYFLGDTPLYDKEKIWSLGGKFYTNNKTVALPIITSWNAAMRESERVLIKTFEPKTGRAKFEGEKNILEADNQVPGKTLVAKRAGIFETGFLEPSGFVHVHETKLDGSIGAVISEDVSLKNVQKPRIIIGHSALISGEASNVAIPLDRSTKEGESVFLMLHRDNGNKKFDPLLVDGYEQIEALDVVEIDKKTTELASKYFHLNLFDPRLRIFHEDGRTYINRTTDRYDIIYVDAFRSFYSVPYQLSTREATLRLRAMLNDGGVVIANIPASLRGSFSKFFQAEYKTYQQIFPHVRAYAVSSPDKEEIVQNIILVAFTSDHIRTLPNDDPQINEDLKNEWKGVVDEGTPTLSDDFAPADYYTNQFVNLEVL